MDALLQLPAARDEYSPPISDFGAGISSNLHHRFLHMDRFLCLVRFTGFSSSISGFLSFSTGEVSLMEVPSLGGVLTRAKTLALRKAAAAVASVSVSSYIQLRGRRLVKPTSEKKQKESGAPINPNKASLRGGNSSRLKVDEKLVGKEVNIRQRTEIKVALEFRIDDEECSFGENMLEIEGSGRWVFLVLV
ncbi:hypothetical protein L1887_18460 [Cichorium endivia]|nr:hypothetical protein L1887_18460 [Cichorium endivia]